MEQQFTSTNALNLNHGLNVITIKFLSEALATKNLDSIMRPMITITISTLFLS